MAIASIQAWLDSPDKSYSYGLALYEQYGDNKTMLALVKSGSTPFHFTKLQAALQLLNQRADLVPKPIVIGQFKPDPINVPNSKEAIDFKDAPEKILEIRAQKTLAYAQARKLHESIRMMDSREHRLKAALELLDHMDFVNESWAIIDEWKEKGTIRETVVKEQAAKLSTLTQAQLLKEQALLGPNITKDKKRLAECTDPRKQVKIQTRLQERMIRMEEVRRRLNEFV